MTIIVIHYTDKNILAIADGLISRGSNRVIEQDQKIVMFKPIYKIPHVSLGHFSGFSEYIGGSFCIAYAGNFSLISTIAKRFVEITTRLLVIDRDTENSGKPTIYQRENSQEYFRSLSYCDSYNFDHSEFDHSELLPITVNFLMNILQSICENVCADFHKNAMEKPDAHFIIFGSETVNHHDANRSQIIKCTDVQSGQLIYERYSVLPWAVNFIGDASVIPSLINDIESTSEYHTRPLIENESGEDEWPWLGKISVMERFCSNREQVIKNKVLSLIQKGTNTIGGDCSIAKSTWSKNLDVLTIRNENIPSHIEV